MNEMTNAATLRRWRLDEVCTCWCERVVDPQGGFFEAIDSAGDAVRASERHVLVQARLTYVFSHASALGGSPRMKEAAVHGFAQLTAWAPAPEAGWARSRQVDGAGANWCNQLSRNGDCLCEVTPARVLYHLLLAIAEVIRLKSAQPKGAFCSER